MMITKLVRIARATTLLAVLLSGWVFAQTPSTEQSSILVTITPDRAIVRVGDTVHCSFVVRNTGDLIVSSLTLEDNSGNGTIALDKSELAKGEEASGEFYYQVPKSALPGPFKISVTAVGKDKYNRDVKANAYTEMPIASLSLTKEASARAVPPGETVVYTFRVENTGSISLTLDRIEDDRLGTLDLGGTVLEPGATLSVRSLPYAVPDDPSGAVVNTATVYGSASVDGEEVELQDTDTAEVMLVHVRLDKTVDQNEAYVGQTITFTITVHNDDSLEQTLHLTDELLGVDMDIVVESNGTWSQDFEYIIPASAGDRLVNVAVLARPGVWELRAEAEVEVLRPTEPGPFDPEDPRNQPWDVSLAVVKVFDTQVFDGRENRLKFLDSSYREIHEIPVSGSLYLEVVDPDQDERPLLREMIFGGWNKDSQAGETAAAGNGSGCPTPSPTREEDSAPIWDLVGSEGSPTPTTSDLMTPAGVNLALRSISGIPATVKILIWDAQTGYWERLDLKETAPDSGVFRSTTCVAVADVRHPGEGNLGASPEDTIFAIYQDPTNHSDIALAMIKVAAGGAGAAQPPGGAPEVGFDRPTYRPGEEVVLTVTDPSWAGQPRIAGEAVLTLEDAAGRVLGSWDEIPAVDEETGVFRTSFTLPGDVPVGTLTATYSDPRIPGRGAEATAQVVAATLQGVSGVEPEPRVLFSSVEFVVHSEPEGFPVERLRVDVYDLTGRRVAALTGEGVTSLPWDGGSLRNGAYIYVAQVEDPGLERTLVFKGFVYIRR